MKIAKINMLKRNAFQKSHKKFKKIDSLQYVKGKSAARFIDFRILANGMSVMIDINLKK